MASSCSNAPSQQVQHALKAVAVRDCQVVYRLFLTYTFGHEPIMKMLWMCAKLPVIALIKPVHVVINNMPCSIQGKDCLVCRRSRGFGFVEYRDPRDADDAMYRMDGSNIGGRDITVRQSAIAATALLVSAL